MNEQAIVAAVLAAGATGRIALTYEDKAGQQRPTHVCRQFLRHLNVDAGTGDTGLDIEALAKAGVAGAQASDIDAGAVAEAQSAAGAPQGQACQAAIDVYDMALSQAAFYVRDHCQNGEEHADIIVALKKPDLLPQQLVRETIETAKLRAQAELQATRLATLENVLRDAANLIDHLGGSGKYIREVLSGVDKPHFAPTSKE